ncbi:MAG: RrF2 family transcriptional regulator [Pleomorphochaeta sp.]
MIVSTKGRYALRVMLDLAKNENEKFESLKDISNRQEISLKYLEAIIGILNKAGFVKSLRGVHGGYKLARDPKNYTVGEILRLTENGLNLVNCEGCSSDGTCSRSSECLTMPIWQNLDKIVNSYLDKISLLDVLNGNYKI